MVIWRYVIMIKQHIQSIFNGKWTWERLYRAYELFEQRQGRGMGYFAKIQSWIQFFMLILITANTTPWLKNYFQIWMVVPFFIGSKLLTYVIGWYDMEKIKIFQKEEVYNKMLYNPMFKMETERLYRIENELRILNGKEQLKPLNEEIMDLIETRLDKK